MKKYKKIFQESLNIDNKTFNENLKYNDIPEWDSIGHMSLVAALEDGYQISIDTDDIVEYSSFKKGVEILKKYKISINEK
jgi:acyl carrier protein